MKTKKVNQYICEFCGKRNYAAWAMKRHEKYCTMNPNRECRMCALIGELPESIEKLKSVLPEMKTVENSWGCIDILNEDEIREAVKKLRNKADNCPACVLATIRQKGIYVNVTGFDYKKEIAGFWADYNAEQLKSERYDCY